MPLTPQHKRLMIVYKDYLKENSEGNQKEFAKKIGVTQGTISRTLTGEYPISRKIIDGVTINMGYSASWFINGKGDKKTNDTTKLVSEIQLLRAEYEIVRSELEKVKSDILLLSKGKQPINS